MGVARPETIRLILEHYNSFADQRAKEEDWWRAQDKPFDEACWRAARSLLPAPPDNKKLHPHQWKPGHDAMKGFAVEVVAAATRLREARDFEELLAQVKGLTKGVPRVADLVAYDVADRIGLSRELSPRHVYHAGHQVRDPRDALSESFDLERAAPRSPGLPQPRCSCRPRRQIPS